MNRVKLTLFDDYWLDYRENAHRRWFEPAYAGFYKDKLFETNVYSAMHYLPALKKYRMWYEVSPDIRNDGYRLLALAESDDGVHFAPCIVHPEREERYRHIVVDHGGVHGSSVFYDALDPDPARRFKYVGMTHTGDPGGTKGVVVEYSADGERFTDDGTRVAHPFYSDALNSIFFNPYDGTYSLILRAGSGDRRIAVRESRDMLAWSEPRLVLTPDPAHNDEMLQTQYYSMAVDYFDGVFYGLLWRYQSSLLSKMNSKMLGTMEAELVYSYDGKLFMPTSGRPLIARPQPPAYGCFQQDMMGMTETADGRGYILYGAGMNIIHGAEIVDRDIGRKRGGDTGASVFYTIRKDGFCGLEAAYGRGEIITKPVCLLSDDIRLNVNAAAGRARFALLDAASFEPLPGFGYEDCLPLEADEVSWKPRFRENALEACVGRRARLGVELFGATLFSMGMDAAPFLSRRQKSFADPMQAK